MRKTVRVALSGYATMDFTGRADAPIVLDGTTPVTIGGGEWPRPGGAPLYAGKILAEAGQDVSILTAVGGDCAGAMFLAHLGQAGLSPATVSVRPGARTPTCILIHQDDGRYCCFFDRGDDAGGEMLSPIQRKSLAEADWVVVSAGPEALSAQLLDLLLPHQKLAWIFKSDALSFPPRLCRSLAKRASVLFCNQHERTALESADCRFATDSIIFETQGGEGVRVHHHDGATAVSTQERFDVDATGAGDTFAGGALSVLFEAGATPVDAAKAGLEAAAALLRGRLAMESEARAEQIDGGFAQAALSSRAPQAHASKSFTDCTRVSHSSGSAATPA